MTNRFLRTFRLPFCLAKDWNHHQIGSHITSMRGQKNLLRCSPWKGVSISFFEDYLFDDDKRRNTQPLFCFNETFFSSVFLLFFPQRFSSVRMRKTQSFEFNHNKKVSLPMNNETDFAPKSSHGWVRRSAATGNARNTVVPVALVQEEVPSYFESTMQSMCLAFFTLAYTEVWKGRDSIPMNIPSLVNRCCCVLGSCDDCSCSPEVSHYSLHWRCPDCGIRIDSCVSSCCAARRCECRGIEDLFIVSSNRVDHCCLGMCCDYVSVCCCFFVCDIPG